MRMIGSFGKKGVPSGSAQMSPWKLTWRSESKKVSETRENSGSPRR